MAYSSQQANKTKPGALAKTIILALGGIASLIILYILSRFNYPLFHSIADMLTVFIAASVFVVVWNRRQLLDNHYYLLVGIAFFFFAILDFLHLVGNKDMGVFPGFGNLGPTLYIASRYVLSVSLLLAPWFIRRRLNTSITLAAYSIVTIFLVISVFYWQNFPITFIEGVGLTPFKVISDYVICGILAGAIGLLLVNRRAFDLKILRILVYALILSIATGLAFTMYTDPFGITNAVGHFFQIGTFYLVYRAFVETVLTKPQDILYRSLKQSREETLKLNTDLKQVNLELKEEIIDHQIAEEALLQAKELAENDRNRFETLLQTDPSGVVIIDKPDGRISFINDRARELYGMDPLGLKWEEHARVGLLKLNGEPYDPEDMPASRSLLKGETVRNEELTLARPDGSRITVTASSAPLKSIYGEIRAVIGVFDDITERKQIEKDLQTSVERLRILSEANSLLLSSEDPEKIVQTIGSRVMEHLHCDCFFNFIADKEAGKLRLNAYAGIPEDTARGIAWLDYGVAVCGCAARDGCRIISENIQENGDVRAALVRSFGVQAYACHPLKIGIETIGTLSFGTRTRTTFSEDELELMKTVAEQVSIAMERKRVELMLKQYARELEATNQELEAFSYSVSHDLRAPLRSLDGFSLAILEDYADKLDQQGKEYLNHIRSSSQLMDRLIDDILDLSRITRAEINLEEIDLSEVAGEVAIELKRLQPERQVEFIIQPGLMARGDRTLVRLVFDNLLGNAFKFTGKVAEARIEFGLANSAENPEFFIRDNGAGFDMKYVDRIFKPFQRLHSAHEFPGTGIGLASVQRIIHRLRGEIRTEGEIGKGATFYFTLPPV